MALSILSLPYSGHSIGSCNTTSPCTVCGYQTMLDLNEQESSGGMPCSFALRS